MKISINIKVRNSDWYWSDDSKLESKEQKSMSRKEWKMINEGKILKHSAFVDFEFDFEVQTHSDNRDGIYNLKIFTSENGNFDDPKEHTIQLKNVTIVKFNGDNQYGDVVISNELIHQYISTQQGHDGRFYCYFYLKTNTEHNKFSENIWLSDNYIEQLKKQYKNFAIEKNERLKIRSIGSLMSL